ncbi:MAG: hypothetical protein MPL62_16010, partial [Alphaproteobacteria bacterium]|nr:hypothetical protein [Alphaproteobacteria bacterium]
MQLQKLLKLAAASMLLLFAGNAALHANHGNGAAGIAPVGETTPITTVDFSGIDASAASDHASREMEFSFLVNTGRAAGSEFGAATELFFNDGDLLITETSAVEAGGLAQPLARAAQNVETVDPVKTIAGRDYNRKVVFSWGGAAKIGWLNHGEWGRGLNFKIRYLKSGGDAHLGIDKGAAESGGWDAATVTFTGPPVAQKARLSLAFGSDGAGAGLPNDHKASAERATQAQGAAGTSIEVTCHVHAAGDPDTDVVAPTGGTTCSVVGTAAVLGGAAGSATQASSPSDDTEYSGDDVTTAMDITIAAGAASGTATFEVQSNSTDATLQFDFRISAVEDYEAANTDLIADEYGNAAVTFRIVDAALQLVALGTDG